MSDTETRGNIPDVPGDRADGPSRRMPHGPEGADIFVLADMFFASKVRAVGAGLGASIAVARDAARLRALAEGHAPRLVLLDLELRGQDLPALIRDLKSNAQFDRTTLIGFASHMNAEAIAAARDAGADRVLARSAFTQLLPTLIGETLR